MNPLEKTPDTHFRFLRKVEDAVSADSRFLGVAVAGSLSEGRADEHSDIDLQIVVKKEDYKNLLAEPETFLSRFGKLLSFFSGEHVGEPRLFICLYEENLLHVDFKFITLEDFGPGRIDDLHVLWEVEGLLNRALHTFPKQIPTADAQWIENRFWTWIHYVATKIARGENMEALDGITWLRRMALAPMVSLIRLVPNRYVRRLEENAKEYYGSFEKTVAARPERHELLRALRECAALYQRLRDDLGQKDLDRKTDAENHVLKYVSLLK